MCSGGPPFGVSPVCSNMAKSFSVSLPEIFISSVLCLMPFILKCSPKRASPAATLNPLSALGDKLVFIFAKSVSGKTERAVSKNFVRFMI